jgi:hypothetical protein
MKNKISGLAAILVLLIILCSVPSKALAYGYDTHALLTKEAIELYNRNTEREIPEYLYNYLLDGSRREDNAPRWLNHFYDPVYDRSLTFDPAIDPGFLLLKGVMGISLKSNDWAQSELRQSLFPYNIAAIIDIKPLSVGSILSGTEQKKISPMDIDADFAWQRALRLYIGGNEEKAMFALGHVLHLVEDMSVPDHTRNDPHAGDSPYENYASRYDLGSPDPVLTARLMERSPLIFNDLDGYFTSLAEYSNKNFYSQDTMGVQSGYPEPIPSFMNREGEQSYGIISDNFGDYKLVTVPSKFNYIFSNTLLSTIDNDEVMSDYWSRLSTKSVEYSAGVIDLFFREAEKYKNDPNGIPGERSFFAMVGEAVGDFFIDAGSAIKGAFSDMVGGNDGDLIGETPLNDEYDNGSAEEEKGGDAVIKKVIPTVSASKKEVKQGQVIHEKGSKFSPSSPATLYFDAPDGRTTSFTLMAGDDGKFDHRYVMPDNAPLGKYIYYAKDDKTGAVSEKISFVVIEGNTKATPSQTGSLKKTEEKKDVVAKKEEKEADVIGVVKTPVPVPTCSYSASGWSPERHVVINEVAWMGSISSPADEWVELKNTSALPVDISGWELIGKGDDIRIKIAMGTMIQPGGFYLLERTDDDSVPGVTADRIYTGALSNTDDGLKLLGPGCLTIDEVSASPAWISGDTLSRRTMERSGSGWQTSTDPGGTPRRENSGGYYGGSSSSPTSSNDDSDEEEIVSVPVCSSKESSPQKTVVFSEIAWSGDASSVAHEWVELYNPSSAEISLAGWQMIDEGGDIRLILDEGDRVPAEGYFLAERGETDFISGVAADAFFTGAINNSDESLYLFDGSCVLIDKVTDVGASWENIGGSASPEFRTAERDGEGWHDYSGIVTNGIMGTPKTMNSARPAEENDESDDEEDGDIDDEEEVDDEEDENIDDEEENDEDENDDEEEDDEEIPVGGETGGSVLISEIMPGIDGSLDDEFIELYNPTSSVISLDGWSIGRRTDAESDESMLVSVESGVLSGLSISPNGFFLIGSNGYSGEKIADIRYSQSSVHLAYDGDIITVYDAGGNTVDEVTYVAIEKGKSWERKALSEGVCLSASGNGEFLGNGCALSDGEIFNKRDIPNPQNTSSLPEPRSAPSMIGSDEIAVSYDPSIVSITFSHGSLPSGLSMKAVDMDSGDDIDISSGSYRIFEINRNYLFKLHVSDADGMMSEPIERSVDVPGFADIGLFSGSKRDFDGNEHPGPIVEMGFGEYPFLPRDLMVVPVYGNSSFPNFKSIVFYLNREAPKDEYLEYEYPPEGTPGVANIFYKSYLSGYSGRRSLMLADGENGYVDGVNHDKALSRKDYLLDGDNKIAFPISGPNGETSLSSNDCLSVAYYGFTRTTIGSEAENKKQFGLIAVDKKKYCFKGDYASSPPTMPGGLTLEPREGRDQLLISWNPSTDPDSPDGLIYYEISYDNGNTWNLCGLGDKVTTTPGENIDVMVRAFDDFGTRSASATGSILIPMTEEIIEGPQEMIGD